MSNTSGHLEHEHLFPPNAEITSHVEHSNHQNYVNRIGLNDVDRILSVISYATNPSRRSNVFNTIWTQKKTMEVRSGLANIAILGNWGWHGHSRGFIRNMGNWEHDILDGTEEESELIGDTGPFEAPAPTKKLHLMQSKPWRCFVWKMNWWTLYIFYRDLNSQLTLNSCSRCPVRDRQPLILGLGIELM